jgi:hypothetical protein
MLIAHLKNIRALFVLIRGAHAVVLVYDVTKETSLTALEVSLAKLSVKVGPPVHNYEHEAGSYGDGFT